VEQLIEDLTRGNVTEVKVVLATVVLALALYQVLLAAVAYGWLRLPFLSSPVASWTHRASGDAILVLTAAVATMCVGYYGFDEGGTHALVACVLLGLLAVKVLVVRLGGRIGRLLPVFGASVFLAFALTWLTSAGDFLGVSG
jgi:Family of unknown function (DUF6529)